MSARADIQPVHACYCPDDCNCRKPWRPNYCGCRAHPAAPTAAAVRADLGAPTQWGPDRKRELAEHRIALSARAHRIGVHAIGDHRLGAR